MRLLPHRRLTALLAPAWVLPFLAIGATANAQATGPDAAAVQRYADQLLDAQRIDPQGPGLTLLVARDQTVLARSARGMASIELGVPLKPEHVMRLGSITKQFAAATLLKLIDEGRARLDDPLSRFLPQYPKGDTITLAQLLDHTSGIRSYTSIEGYMVNPVRRDLSTAELIAEFKDLPMDFAPGTQHRYNNSGYVLVGAVIEAITGQPWHEALQQRLLGPAQVAVSYPAPDRLVPGHVSGYTRGPQGVAPAGLISMTQPHAAGALVGNVEALWRWNQLLHESRLLTPATYARMTQPQGPAAAQGYGFGIAAGQVRGLAMLQHGGGIHGFNTQLTYLPGPRVTVALLRNSDSGPLNLEALARQLAAFAAGQAYPEVKPVALAPEALKAYEGVYALGQATRQLRVVDGQLTSQRSGGQPIALAPLGQDRFAFAGMVAQLQFRRGADGRVTEQVYYPDADEAGGGAQIWPRSGDLPVFAEVALSAEQRQALVGDYAGGPLKLKVFVDAQGVLRVQAVGQGVLTLKASGPRETRIVEVDATLSFAPAEGPAQSVTLRQGPTVLEMKRQ